MKNLTLTGSNAGYSLGGFAYINNGTISGCTNEIIMTNENSGIAYENYGTIIGCVNRADIKVESCYVRIGGIVESNNEGATVKACYNLGNITVTNVSNYEVGGIAGYSYNTSSFIGCYNMGEISETVTQGGICGQANGNSAPVIKNCYWGNSSSVNAIGLDMTTKTDISTCGYVTGEGENTWAVAMIAMNSALEGSGWQYVVNTDDATKEVEPLKLVKENNP